MKRRRFTEEQITYALRQAGARILARDFAEVIPGVSGFGCAAALVFATLGLAVPPMAAATLFEDVSHQFGVVRSHEPEPYGPLWGELNGDGWIDLVFMNHGDRPSFYFNQTGQSFWDAFPWAGVGGTESYTERADRHGCSCGDFDNDGRIDLFIAHGAHRKQTLGTKSDELLRNLGEARFSDITQAAGVMNAHGRARGGAWVDFDRDGHLDLHVTNFRTPDVLYRNNGDGTFADVGDSLRLPVGGGVSVWLHLDRDGWPDLVTALPLALYRNNRGRGFLRVPGAGTSTLASPRSVAAGDYDGDGYDDLFFTSNGTGGNRLLHNTGRGFAEVPGDFGPPAAAADGSAAWGDLDNDGDLDLLVCTAGALLHFRNTDGRLKRAEAVIAATIVPGPGADLALGDLDNDGDLDLALHTDERQYLLRNTTRGNNWLEIELVGTASNRLGFGAECVLTDNQGRLQYRCRLGGAGGFSRGCGPVHFGLGAARPAELLVIWPSGRRTRLTGIPENRRIVVTEE